MEKLVSLILERFGREDQELFLKAKFVFFLILTAVVILCVTISYTCFTFGITSLTVIIQLIGLCIMLTALRLLTKGRYIASVHTIFITGFSVAWILMFIEPVSSILIKLDTIVFIIGLISALPLVFHRTPKPIVWYFAANYTVFIGFNYYLLKAADLSFKEHIDYALDNTAAMIIVFVVSYFLFNIYSQVLNSLRQMQLLLRSIIDSISSIIIGIDKDCKILMWNRQALKATGLSQNLEVGTLIFDIMPQLQKHKDVIEKVLDSNRPLRHHKMYCSCHQKEKTLDLAVYPLSVGDPNGAVIRIDDITKRIKMEELIVQSEKMLSVGGLAAGLAHELNNPLAGMIQSAQVITNRLTQVSPVNLKAATDAGIDLNKITDFIDKRGILKLLNNINQAGKTASQIVRNMLDFTRRTDSTKDSVNITELVNNAIILAQNDYNLKKKTDFKNIKIDKRYNPDYCATVECESGKIHQVLFNILKNASEAFCEVKSMKDQKQIIINLFEEPEFVCVEIEDNGPGMDEQVRKRVFEPFFTTKAVGKGTGLGLSVSYFIVVEDHGGKMEVKSSPGKGTKFIICLPKKSRQMALERSPVS